MIGFVLCTNVTQSLSSSFASVIMALTVIGFALQSTITAACRLPLHVLTDQRPEKGALLRVKHRSMDACCGSAQGSMASMPFLPLIVYAIVHPVALVLLHQELGAVQLTCFDG